MNLEKFISFVTNHNEAIIQWLFLVILLLAGSLIARSLFGKKSDEGTVGIGGSDLQSALEKILAQTTKSEAAVVTAGSAPPAEVEAQIVALKADLVAREAELNQLKAGGGGAVTAENSAGLGARIKELEAKLSEYEILEDDIADLSLYKDENSRLKTELEQLRAGGAPAPTPTPTPAPAPVAPPPETSLDVPGGEDIVAEFAQAVGEEAQVEAPAGPSVEIPNTGNPMADFESTVQIEKQMAEPIAVSPLPPPQPAAPAPAAPAPAAAAQAEADDLFAEFANAAPEEGSATLDTDKMMAEMAALVNIEPSADSSLEESIDTDKMAEEATSFTKS